MSSHEAVIGVTTLLAGGVVADEEAMLVEERLYNEDSKRLEYPLQLDLMKEAFHTINNDRSRTMLSSNAIIVDVKKGHSKKVPYNDLMSSKR
jgi:hypothetical protein